MLAFLRCFLFYLIELLTSTPIEHVPVAPSSAAPALHASAPQPAAAAQNTASPMTAPATTSVVQESFSSSFQR